MDFDVTLPLRLGQFLKLTGLAETGGQARELIESGALEVNGTVETHRGRHLADGDVVTCQGQSARVLAVAE